MIHKDELSNTNDQLLSVIKKLIVIILILICSIAILPFIFYYSIQPKKPESVIVPYIEENNAKKEETSYWRPASLDLIKDTARKALAEYGKELIVHTSKYLGPKGTVKQMSNGLNCQNCHLEAGSAVFGNNYGSVNSMYPKFRARSGSIETIYKRINDCFERSLNGTSLDTNTHEMQAIANYIHYIGSNVPKGKKAEGSGLKDIALLDRAADPEKGQRVYEAKCASCHQANGGGAYAADKTEFTYPALWGPNSYNDGAGLYRISNFAKFVKYNMPQGTKHESPQLTDEEAWDVAAFVNSQPRPHKSVPKDWPNKAKKPMDHPFGPYADSFSEKQHKYGPYQSIISFQKNREAINKSK